MSEENKSERPMTVRERFHETLVKQAARIKSVRNDVYTVKYWQIAINFVLGIGAIALLIAAMATKGKLSVGLIIGGLCAAAAVLAFNCALKLKLPSSFLQYTVIENDKRYCFQILSKSHALFTDGEHTVAVDKYSFTDKENAVGPQYRFDFFADMDADVRIGKADKEIFKGTVEFEGKTYKSKIVFKNGAPYYGSLGGVRIKYFDINDTKEKFVVPDTLRAAAEELGVEIPKLGGIYYKDAHTNMMKQ